MNPGFGDRLRTLRQAAGLSQVDLAGDRLSPSYISLLESGKRQPSTDALQLIADRLRCTVDDLLDPSSPEQTEHAKLEIAFARLALANGEVEDARHRLESVLAGGPPERQLQDDARFLLADAYWRVGEYGAAITTLLPVYQRALHRATHLPVTVLGLRLTGYYLDAGDLAAAIRHGESALQVMAEQGLEGTDEYLRAAATVIGAYYESGDLAHAAATVTDLIERAESQANPSGQSALYWNAAAVAQAQGRLSDALHLCERALALFSEQGPSRDLGRLYTTCAFYLLQARPDLADQAVTHLERALPLIRDHAADLDLGEWEATRAVAELARGELIAAEDFARRAVVTLGREIRTERVRAYLALGDALFLQGRPEEAGASYGAARSVLEQCLPSRITAAIWREISDRLLRNGEAEAALRALHRALDHAGVRSVGLPVPAGSPTMSAAPAAPAPAALGRDGASTASLAGLVPQDRRVGTGG